MGIFRDLQEKLYAMASSYGELKALERLFSDQFLRGIEQSERKALGTTQRQSVYVDLAWIDKIPLAQFCTPQVDHNGQTISGRVELGDLLIHRTDTIVTRKDVFVRDSRSVIVQAKITKHTNPIVPVGPMSVTRCTSTSKELKLLQDWPTFDLYETSRSLSKLLENVSINTADPHSFFAAFVKPTASWLVGKATLDTPCNEDFDAFFANLRDRNYGASTQDDSEWAKLTHQVLGVARNRRLPPSLNKVNKSVRGRVQSAVVHAAGFSFRLLPRRRMAVIMIDVVFDEMS